MSVIISGFSSCSRDFSDTENAAIDAASFSLSEGNWRQHMNELFFCEPHGTEMPAHAMERAATEYINIYENRMPANANLRWHVELARKVKALAKVTLAQGGDTVGIAG